MGARTSFQRYVAEAGGAIGVAEASVYFETSRSLVRELADELEAPTVGRSIIITESIAGDLADSISEALRDDDEDADDDDDDDADDDGEDD